MTTRESFREWSREWSREGSGRDRPRVHARQCSESHRPGGCRHLLLITAAREPGKGSCPWPASTGDPTDGGAPGGANTRVARRRASTSGGSSTPSGTSTSSAATSPRGVYVDPKKGHVTFKAFAEEWRAIQPHRPGTATSVEQDLRLHIYPAARGQAAYLDSTEPRAGARVVARSACALDPSSGLRTRHRGLPRRRPGSTRRDITVRRSQPRQWTPDRCHRDPDDRTRRQPRG